MILFTQLTGGCLPTDKSSIVQRIARAELSPSHRQIADYVLDRPLRVATMRVEDLAEIVGVSVPTVNRFARALDFEGYAQFRAALVRDFEAALAPVEKLRAAPDDTGNAANVFADALAQIAQNTERTMRMLSEEECRRAVEAILTARRICIIGLGASAWLGGLLQHRLDSICDDIHSLASVEGAAYAAKALRRLGPGDLAIAIAFPRYLADTILLAKRARETGAAILVLTDSPHSPIAPLADIALYAATESRFFANCEAAVLALIEALAAAVAHASGRSIEAAERLVEAVLPWLHDGHSTELRPSLAKAVPKTGAPRANAATDAPAESSKDHP